jgi:bacteriorhodopsin
MIDFASSPTWFLYGIGVTVLLCVLMVVFVLFADKAQHR